MTEKIQKLVLATVTIEQHGSELVIKHKTGMQTTVAAAKLDNWCVGLLRKELTNPQQRGNP